MKDALRKLVDKRHIFFTKSGDHAIRYALKRLKGKILMQDQGGWITYRQYAKRFKLDIVELETDYGLLDPKKLKSHKDCALIINSLPGYHALQNMKIITDICRSHNIRLINDVSGSIGTESAKYGDVVLGSFGKDKPINLHDGGFLASDQKFSELPEEHKPDLEILSSELKRLKGKLSKYKDIREKIKKDLESFTIIHEDSYGINLIVLFSTGSEKETLIKYCSQENYEFTLCPRNIRVNVPAISIEIKRIQR